MLICFPRYLFLFCPCIAVSSSILWCLPVLCFYSNFYFYCPFCSFILSLFVIAPCFTVLSHVSNSSLVSFHYLCSYFLFSHTSPLSSLPVSSHFCMNIVPTVHFVNISYYFCVLFYTVHIGHVSFILNLCTSIMRNVCYGIKLKKKNCIFLCIFIFHSELLHMSNFDFGGVVLLLFIYTVFLSCNCNLIFFLHVILTNLIFWFLFHKMYSYFDPPMLNAFLGLPFP